MVHLFSKTGNSSLMPLIQVKIHTFISTRAKTGSTNSPMVSKQLMFLVTRIYAGPRFKFLKANCPLQITFLSKIIIRIQAFAILRLCVKSVHIRSFSGLHFPTFEVNMERYSISLRIQSEYGKIRTRKTPNTDISHAVKVSITIKKIFNCIKTACEKSIPFEGVIDLVHFLRGI